MRLNMRCHKSIFSNNIVPKDNTVSERIIGIEVKASINEPLFIFGFYMLTDSNLKMYRNE